MADSIFEPEVKRSLARLQSLYGEWVPSLAIECKRTEEPRLAFSRVKDHQIAGLLDFERHGMVRKLIVSQGFGGKSRFTGDTPFDFVIASKGLGYVLVNFRFTRKTPRKDIARGTNKCYGVPISAYVKAKAEFEKEGRASLDYSWFEENAILCDRIKILYADKDSAYGWDLLPLVKDRGDRYE